MSKHEKDSVDGNGGDSNSEYVRVIKVLTVLLYSDGEIKRLWDVDRLIHCIEVDELDVEVANEMKKFLYGKGI